MVMYDLSRLRWKRAPRLWCSVLISFLILLLLSRLIDASVSERQAALETMQNKTAVRVTLTNRQGKADDLKLLNGVTWSFFHGGLTKYVGETSIRSHEAVETDIGPLTMTGISGHRYRELIGLSVQLPISWCEGYDDTCLDTEEAVCIIGENLLPVVEEHPDGSRFLQCELRYDNCEKRTFRVVGTAPEDDALYVPWMALYRWSIAIQVDDFSFTLADNALLDEWKAVVQAEFGTPNQKGYDPWFPAIITHDTQYRELTAAGQKNLLILTLLRPILMLCAAGCGLLIGFFAVRLRQGELALLRSLGVSTGALLRQGAVEILLPCAAVCVAMMLYRPNWLYGALLVCYAAGYLAPLLRCCCKPLLAQFRLLEGTSC